MQTITVREEALRLREQGRNSADIAKYLGLTVAEVIEMFRESVHAQAAERRRAPRSPKAAVNDDRLSRIAKLLGCKAAEIEQAITDLTDALAEEAERREAAEARIAHVERGRLEAVEELLKARRALRLERERLTGTPATEADDDEPVMWSAWMRPSQLADGLGLHRSLVSKAAINKQGTVAGRAIEVRRRLTAEERAANPGSRYLIRYELTTEEGAR